MRAAVADWPNRAVANLATNPSFESTDSIVEVWRNLIPNPEAANSLTSWANLSGASIARVADPTCPEPVPYVAELTCPGAVASEGVWWQATVAAVAIGTVHSGAAWVKAPAGTPLYAAVRISLLTNQSDTEFIATGDWQRVSASRVSTTAGATDVYFMVRTRYQAAVQFRVGAPVFCAGNAVPAYFSGARSSDPDLTPSWAGAANNSASVLRGAQLVGVSGGKGRVGFRSSRWSRSGAWSLRAVTIGDQWSPIYVAGTNTPGLAGQGVTLVAGQTYTVLATCHLEAPQTGTLHAAARRITFHGAGGGAEMPVAPTYQSAQAPNQAGDHDLRLTFTIPLAFDVGAIMLFGGAPAGGGDIWWDDLMIVEGVYAGPYRGPG